MPGTRDPRGAPHAARRDPPRTGTARRPARPALPRCRWSAA